MTGVLATVNSDRGSGWSITIFDEDKSWETATLPAKWALVGQMEKCPDTGKIHFQGMLTTPQVRFSAVKRVFPKAHIELARDKRALHAYVRKEDTRIQSLPDRCSNIPTLWDYSDKLAVSYIEEEFKKFQDKYSDQEICKLTKNDMLLEYIDTLVCKDIESGQKGVEFICVNPMFRSAWKRYGTSIVSRYHSILDKNISSDRSIEDASTQPQISEETESVQQDIPREDDSNRQE